MTTMESLKQPIDRRRLLATTAVATLMPFGVARASNSETEKANEQLVNAFCADWSKRDAAVLTEYFTDDIVYQITTGMPLVEGKQDFLAQLGPFMNRFETINWEILRSAAMGDVVVNDRLDYFIAPEGGRSVTYHVTGVFIVADGKIRDWRDYPFPKEETIGAPAQGL